MSLNGLYGETTLSNVSKEPNQYIASATEDEMWLSRQIEKATENLKSKPIERRGPHLITDEDLNQIYRVR